MKTGMVLDEIVHRFPRLLSCLARRTGNAMRGLSTSATRARSGGRRRPEASGKRRRLAGFSR